MALDSYPPVLVTGVSGSGKSSMLRNVPNPERVAVLNVELKVSPTRNAMKLKSVEIKSYRMFNEALKQAMESPDIDLVFIDSFTALSDLLYRYCKTQFNGYEIWGQYNDLLYEFMQNIKKNSKPLFVTAIPETLEIGFDQKQYARCKGKEFRYGGVESNFAIVLFTDPLDEDGTMKYRLHTSPSIKNSSKSPEGMMPEYIDNDVVVIQKHIEEYYA